MKKFRCLSLILCAALVLAGAVLPAFAAETTAVVPETLPQEVELEFGQFCVEQGCRTIDGKVPLGGSDRRLDTAQSAFLYDVNTETVIYSYNPDNRVSAGTLTKLVAALVALDHKGLKDTITINTNNISRLPGGSTNIKLKNGETVTVEDMLYAMLLANANDAAVVLAEGIAGTQQNYVLLMNQKVQQLGCTNTEFGNIHGLDNATCVTSARDMAKIVQEVIRNPELKTIFGAIQYVIPETEKSDERELTTGNHFITNLNVPDFVDPKVTGGFQSMTDVAGASIVVTAESGKMSLIGVSLGSVRTYKENGWSVLSYGNFNEMRDLLNWAYASFKVNRIVYDGMALGQFSVIGGESNVVGEARVEVDSVVPIKAQMDNLQMNFSVQRGLLTAPIDKGEQIATMELKYMNSILTEVEVYAMGTVKAADNTGVTIRSTAIRSDEDSSGIMTVIGVICIIVLALAALYLVFNAYMRSRMRARRKKRRAERRRMR